LRTERQTDLTAFSFQHIV